MWRKTFFKFSQALAAFAGTKHARYLVYALFVVQVVYLIFSVQVGLPPDELTHIRFIEYYTYNSLDPFIGSQTDWFALGDVTREVSYLYHYLMSLVLRVSPFTALNEYILLRFVGLALAFGTLVFSAKTFQLLKVPAGVITLGLFIVTNMAEFMLLSGAVNNDNMVWFITAGSMYLLVKLWTERKGQLRTLLFLATIVALGAITKKTFLPLALVFAGGGVLFSVMNWKLLIDQLKQSKWREWLLIGALVFSVGLAIERIGVNLVQYRAIDAPCADIHTVEQCSEYGVLRRNYRLDSLNVEGQTSLKVFAVPWLYGTIGLSFGVQGWGGQTMPPFWFIAIVFLAMLATIYSSLRQKEKDRTRHWLLIGILGLSWFYILVNLNVNYGIYQKWDRFGLALQGRYIFPILVPFVLVSVYYLWNLLRGAREKRFIPVIAAAFCILLVVYSGVYRTMREGLYVREPAGFLILTEPENAVGGQEPWL